jgi:hypothetical protein
LVSIDLTRFVSEAFPGTAIGTGTGAAAWDWTSDATAGDGVPEGSGSTGFGARTGGVLVNWVMK